MSVVFLINRKSLALWKISVICGRNFPIFKPIAKCSEAVNNKLTTFKPFPNIRFMMWVLAVFDGVRWKCWFHKPNLKLPLLKGFIGTRNTFIALFYPRRFLHSAILISIPKTFKNQMSLLPFPFHNFFSHLSSTSIYRKS